APCAFGHRLELGPADRRVADPGAEPAIGPGGHVLAANEVGVANQSFSHQIGMLDEICAMADHTRDKGGSIRQFYLLEDSPLMLVTGVRGLDRVAAGAHPKDQIDDVLQWDIVVMGTVEAAPADMQPDLFPRNVAQRVVECVDSQRRVSAVLRDRYAGQASPAVREV